MSARTRPMRWMGGAFLVLTLLAPVACGDDPTETGDPAIAPFVGDWRALEMVLTSVANPDVAPDLIEQGASFDLNVQPSGAYTAILTFLGQALTEIGSISVSGNTVTLNRTFPTAEVTTATYVFAGNQLTLDGESEFDFNLDGTSEPATAHIVLQKR